MADPGGLLAIVPQDPHLPRRFGLLHLAAPALRQCRADEAAKKDAAGNLARGDHRTRRGNRGAAQGRRRARPVAYRLARPRESATGHRATAAVLARPPGFLVWF